MTPQPQSEKALGDEITIAGAQLVLGLYASDSQSSYDNSSGTLMHHSLFMSGFLDWFLPRSQFTEHAALDQTGCHNKALRLSGAAVLLLAAPGFLSTSC